jgi:hypothetical protein
MARKRGACVICGLGLVLGQQHTFVERCQFRSAVALACGLFWKSKGDLVARVAGPSVHAVATFPDFFVWLTAVRGSKTKMAWSVKACFLRSVTWPDVLAAVAVFWASWIGTRELHKFGKLAIRLSSSVHTPKHNFKGDAVTDNGRSLRFGKY